MGRVWIPLSQPCPEDSDDRRFNYQDTDQIRDPATNKEFDDCYGIVDEDTGGFVAYAVGEKMAAFIVSALRLTHGVY